MPNHRAPYIDWKKYGPLLGVKSDTALAKEIGCARATITMQRQRRGISVSGHACQPKGWTAKEISILGTIADEAAARRLGRSLAGLTRKRRALGIPPLYPEADNRASTSAAAVDPEVKAAIRRARKVGIAEDQIKYIFGDLCYAT